jgi:diguanylate cyclase (GGDEF)-like protein
MRKPPKVILAGNDSEDLIVIRSTLDSEGELILSSNSQQVVKQASDCDYLDLVIIDMDAIDDGNDLCMRLKAQFSRDNLPIVMIGGEGDQAKEKSMDLGALDYFTRPLSTQISIARIKHYIELKRKTDLLTELAGLDGLTCLASQEAFDERMDNEWRRAVREYHSISVLLINVDGFNAFNESNGYGAGDECLRQVARILDHCCTRAADFVARLGSDEFAVILPGNDLDSALIVADKMCESVQKLGIANENTVGGVITISIGAASVEPSQGDKYRALLDEAEEMLYRARQLGGNQSQGISL